MAKRPFASRLWYEFLRRVLQLAAVLLYRVRHTGYHIRRWWAWAARDG